MLSEKQLKVTKRTYFSATPPFRDALLVDCAKSLRRPIMGLCTTPKRNETADQLWTMGNPVEGYDVNCYPFWEQPSLLCQVPFAI